MWFDFRSLPGRSKYKLLTATVIPRPIALVTSLNCDGSVNAAPFSFFNVFSEEPALVVLGLEGSHDGMPKHTTRNICECGEFVVNLVDEAIADAMVKCAARLPKNTSELQFAGLSSVPSELIDTPRIAEAPISLECRSYKNLKVSQTRTLAIGEVLAMTVRDGMIDPETLRLNWDRYDPVGRLYANNYVRLHDRFEMFIPEPDDGNQQGKK